MDHLQLIQAVIVVIIGLVANSVILANVLKTALGYVEKNLARVEAETARAHARIDELLRAQPWQQLRAEPQAGDSKRVAWLQR